MMNFYKSACLVVIANLAAAPLFAQTGVHFVAQQLRPADPTQIAMAYAGTAFRNGHWAPLANPAGLATLERKQFGYSYQPSHKLIFISNEAYFAQHNFSISFPVKNFKVGFYFSDLDLGHQTITDETGPDPIAEGDAGFQQYQMSMAYKVGILDQSWLMFGANAKYVNEDYVFSAGDAILFDLGLRSDFVGSKRTFSLGATVTNLGGNMEYKMLRGGKVEEEVINLMKAGLAFQNTGAQYSPDLRYILSLEYQKNIDDNSDYKDLWEVLSWAGEVRFFNNLFAQLGYVQNLTQNDDPDKLGGWTWGFGFETPQPLKIFKPVYIGLSYGRGIEFGELDMNVISISVSQAK